MKTLAKRKFGIRMPENALPKYLVYLVFLLLVNLLIFWVMHSLHPIIYGENDDFAMQNLLSGALGDYYLYFPTSNVAFSAVIAGLYQAFPVANWFAIYMMCALILSWAFVGSLLMKKFGIKIGLPLYLVLVPLTFGAFLTYFTFTVITHSLLIGALACLVSAFYAEDKALRRFLYISFVVLQLLAVFIRKEAVGTAAVYGGLFVLFALIRYKKRAIALIGVAAASFAVVGAFYAADLAYYKNDSEAGEFKRWYEARGGLVDFGIPDYNGHAEEYEKLGWTPADITMVRFHMFPDDPEFSTEAFEYVASMREDSPIITNGEAVLSQFLLIFTDNKYPAGFVVVLVVLCGAFVAAWFSAGKKIVAALLFALPFLLHIAFIMLQRAPTRMVLPHYLLSIVMLLGMVDTGALKKDSSADTKALYKRLGTVFCAFLLSVAGVLNATMFFRQHKAGADKGDQQKIITQDKLYDSIAGDKEHLYVCTSENHIMLQMCFAHSVFHMFPQGYFSNSLHLGGWNARSPFYTGTLEKYSVDMLPRDIIDNENVYIVIWKGEEMLTEFFYQKYGVSVKYEIVQSFDDTVFVCKATVGTEEEKGLVY
ncbi:MAG: hypothetical protein ACOYJB_02180 [Christensenellaceae bacterium]|jgi:hypothetical protein